MHFKNYVRRIIFAVFFFLPNLAAADSYGDPFLVNTYTPGAQRAGGISVGANGDTAVLIGDAARGNAYFVRRYDGAGRVLDTQDWFVGYGVTAVAVAGNGNVAVIRSSPDGSGQGLFFTLFSRTGGILVPEFRVNDVTAGDQYFGGFAMNETGQFVVAWFQRNGGGFDAIVKRYQADGSAATPATVVRASPYALITVTPAIDGLGNIVVAWSESLSANNTDFNVFARRYNSTGIALGSSFRVNSYTVGTQVSSTITMNAIGSFVITWTSLSQATAGSWDVYVQRYAATGASLGGELRVSQESSYHQPIASAALASDGAFVVAWDVDNQGLSAAALPYVVGRGYSSNGTIAGEPFVVSTSADKQNRIPRIASDPGGATFFAWNEYDLPAAQSDIRARRYMPTGVTAPSIPSTGQLTELSGAAASWQYFKIRVPAGETSLEAAIAGNVGDADLYVRFGALPTATQWDGRPYLNGSNESVEMLNWPAGDWYVGINGYTDFSALSLEAASH